MFIEAINSHLQVKVAGDGREARGWPTARRRGHAEASRTRAPRGLVFVVVDFRSWRGRALTLPLKTNAWDTPPPLGNIKAKSEVS